MAFDHASYSELRPMLYHTTHRNNISRIRAAGFLESARSLMGAANADHLKGVRRPVPIILNIGNEKVWIADQSPLHEGNIAFQGGWTLPFLIEQLNGLVFFWPGDHEGPVSHGLRHFKSYEPETRAILRVRFLSIAERNTATPLLCKYNSGSPRCSYGKKSPRGPRTFLVASQCDFREAQTVEVAFPGRVALPADTEYSDSPVGPWRRLFDKS